MTTPSGIPIAVPYGRDPDSAYRGPETSEVVTEAAAPLTAGPEHMHRSWGSPGAFLPRPARTAIDISRTPPA